MHGAPRIADILAPFGQRIREPGLAIRSLVDLTTVRAREFQIAELLACSATCLLGIGTGGHELAHAHL